MNNNLNPNHFKDTDVYEEYNVANEGLVGIENHHLTKKGLIAKMRVWDESEHGVEAFIYDITETEIKKLGGTMPNDIRRIED